MTFFIFAHERRALAGLDVLELDDLRWPGIHFKGYSVAELACSGTGNFLLGIVNILFVSTI